MCASGDGTADRVCLPRSAVLSRCVATLSDRCFLPSSSIHEVLLGFGLGGDAKSALATGILACQQRFATPAEGHFSYAESIAGFVAFTGRVRRPEIGCFCRVAVTDVSGPTVQRRVENRRVVTVQGLGRATQQWRQSIDAGGVSSRRGRVHLRCCHLGFRRNRASNRPSAVFAVALWRMAPLPHRWCCCPDE